MGKYNYENIMLYKVYMLICSHPLLSNTEISIDLPPTANSSSIMCDVPTSFEMATDSKAIAELPVIQIYEIVPDKANVVTCGRVANALTSTHTPP